MFHLLSLLTKVFFTRLLSCKWWISSHPLHVTQENRCGRESTASRERGEHSALSGLSHKQPSQVSRESPARNYASATELTDEARSPHWRLVKMIKGKSCTELGEVTSCQLENCGSCSLKKTTFSSPTLKTKCSLEGQILKLRLPLAASWEEFFCLFVWIGVSWN